MRTNQAESWPIETAAKTFWWSDIQLCKKIHHHTIFKLTKLPKRKDWKCRCHNGPYVNGLLEFRARGFSSFQFSNFKFFLWCCWLVIWWVTSSNSRPLALPWCCVTSKLVISLVPRRPGGSSAEPVRRGVNREPMRFQLFHHHDAESSGSHWVQVGLSLRLAPVALAAYQARARARGLWLSSSSCSAFCTVTALAVFWLQWSQWIAFKISRT